MPIRPRRWTWQAAPETLWLKLLELEDALIPEGLHIVGRKMDAAARARLLAQVDCDDDTRAAMDLALQGDAELDGINARAVCAVYRAGARR